MDARFRVLLIKDVYPSLKALRTAVAAVTPPLTNTFPAINAIELRANEAVITASEIQAWMEACPLFSVLLLRTDLQ